MPVTQPVTSLDLLNLSRNSLSSPCEIHQSEQLSFPSAITSAIFLILLGLTGVTGNLLVILVYCLLSWGLSRRSMPRDGGCSPQNVAFIQSRRGKGILSPLKQKNRLGVELIISLAVLDLMICLFILPCDVVHSITCAFAGDWHAVTSNSTTGRSTYYHMMTEILHLMRNIAFGCEGGILLAIAFERFHVIVIGSQHLRCSTPTPIVKGKPEDPDDKQRYPGMSQSSFFSQTGEGGNIQNGNRSQNRAISSRLVLTTLSLRFIVWSMVLGNLLLISIIECIVIVSHAQPAVCHLTDVLRKYADRIYMALVFVSFCLISYFYMRIFWVVRRTDAQKIAWRTSRFKERSGTSQLPVEDCQSPVEPFFDDGKAEKPSESTAKRMRQKRPFRSRRTGKMLFLTTIVFYATLVPLVVSHLITWCREAEVHPPEASNNASNTTTIINTRQSRIADEDIWLHHEFYYLNSVSNVFIYSLLNPTFRREICALLGSRR